ncbi:MAG: TRAP transporter small permease [Cohaesibacteraceae bacterium]
MTNPLSISRLVLQLSRLCAMIGAGGLLLLSLAITANILLRWLFSAPVHGVDDIAYLVTATAIAAAAPLCFLRRGNIRVDILGRISSDDSRVGYRLLEAFGGLITLAVVGLMTWQLALFAAENTASGAETLVLGWPSGPWWWAVAGFFGLTVLSQITAVAQALMPSMETGSEHD